MSGHVPSSRSRLDHDRSEILSGPADDPKPASKKSIFIAASVLVAGLAGVGAGFAVSRVIDSPPPGPAPAALNQVNPDKTGTDGADAAQAGSDQEEVDQTGTRQAGGDGGGQDREPARSGAAGSSAAGGSDSSGGSGVEAQQSDRNDTAGKSGQARPRSGAGGNRAGSSTGSGSTGWDELADGPPGAIPGQCASSGC